MKQKYSAIPFFSQNRKFELNIKVGGKFISTGSNHTQFFGATLCLKVALVISTDRTSFFFFLHSKYFFQYSYCVYFNLCLVRATSNIMSEMEQLQSKKDSIPWKIYIYIYIYIHTLERLFTNCFLQHIYVHALTSSKNIGSTCKMQLLRTLIIILFKIIFH